MSSRRISEREFESYVEEALASVPAVFRKYLDNVVVAVEDEPTDEDYDETDTPDDEDLFGIFRGPILRECATRGEAVREIRDTVVHEIGHMLGLEDGEMPY